MRLLTAAAVILINLVLQTTLFQNIEIIGVKPNTAILIIVIYAMLRGDVEGAVFGFFSGLVHDLYFGQYIGMYALLGLLTGYFCGKPFKDFYRENYLQPLILVGISGLCYGLVFYFLNFLFIGRVDVFYYFRRIILPETVYTTILTLPVYHMAYRVNSMLEEHERFGRKLF